MKKYKELNRLICEVINEFDLVNYTLLNIEDKESVGNLLMLCDKSNGYNIAGLEMEKQLNIISKNLDMSEHLISMQEAYTSFFNQDTQ